MAQKIIVPAHTVKLIDLQNSIPNGKFKKIFFQCALKEIIENGSDLEAHFAVIAYVGKRKITRDWKIGTKVNCTPDTTTAPKEFNLADYDEPIGFANNEVFDFDFTLKAMKSKTAEPIKVSQAKLMKRIKQLLKDKQKAKTAFLTCTARISDNPHVTYDLTLEGNTAAANPSPPADPY